MKNKSESKAITVARAHVEAWSNHEWEASKKLLSSDVKFNGMTTQSNMPPTDHTGIEDYMEGLIPFAKAIEPGSAHIISSTGDETNALIVLTVRASFLPGAPKVTLTAARLYLIDEESKIKDERIIFFAVSD